MPVQCAQANESFVRCLLCESHSIKYLPWVSGKPPFERYLMISAVCIPPDQERVETAQGALRTSQTLLIQRAWSVYLPILTGKHRAWKEGWQQNPMGFLSQPRKRQVNRQRPSQDGRTRGLGIAGSPSRERIEERNTQPLLFPFLLPVSFHPSFPLSLPPMLLNSPMLKSGDQAAQGCNSSGSAPKDIEQSEEVVSGSEGASERCPASQPSRQMAKRLKCVC